MLERVRCLIVRRCKLCHLLDAVFSGSELVEADQVERVTQLSARWIRRVIAVQVSARIVDDRSGACGSGLESVTTVSRGLVYVRQKLLDSLRDRIGPAERADQTRLRERILLPLTSRSQLC